MTKSILNKQSITFLFVLSILVLVSVSILTYMNTKDQTTDHDFISQAFQRNALIDNILSLLNDAETSRRGYFLTSDKDFVVNIDANKLTADSLLIQLRKNSLDNSNQLANAEALIPLVKERFSLFNEGIEIQDKKGTNIKLHKNIFDKGKIANIDIRNLANKMKMEELKNLERNKENTAVSYQFTYYTFIAGIGASALLFFIVFITLNKRASYSFALENQEISREELEQIVKERTFEISQINQKLYKKVDELQIMDADLKKSEELYRKLFEQAHDAIVIFNPEDEKVIDVNRRACDLYGFKRDEFLGISLASISKNTNQGRDNIKLTFEKGYYHNFQSVQYKKDMTEMLMEINASVFMYNGKKVILSINRDITDRILKIPM